MEANLPSKFWYQAAETAVFLHNRTICKSSGDLSITPFELWHKRKPDIHHIRVFGCSAQILIRKPLRGGKFEEVTNDGVLLGFVDDNFNYRVFNLDTNRIVISHNVYFQKDVFPFKQLLHEPPTFQDELPDTPSEPAIPDPPERPTCLEDDETTHLPIQDTSQPDPPNVPDNSQPDPPNNSPVNQPPTAELRRSSRTHQPPVRYTPSNNCVVLSSRRTTSLAQAQTLHHTFWHNPDSFIDSPDEPDAYAFSTSPTTRLLDEPRTYAQAMASPNAECWKTACEKEIDMFRQKGVWHLVPRPTNKNVIKGRWVFKIKLKENGSIAKFKARYVAKGYSQVEGVDFFETFSPTGKPASSGLLLPLPLLTGGR